MGSPLVSIIVPVYNTSEYVEECIQSILSQSYKEIELILINDGSTDSSAEVCKRYCTLPNVQYFEQERCGVVAARKCGVSMSRGEWISFVDSDDYLLPGAVQKLLSHSRESDIVISRNYGGRALQDVPDYFSSEEYLFRVYSISTSVSPCAKLFRRKLFENNQFAFMYDLELAEDHPMNIAIALSNTRNVAICRDAVYYYRQRPGSRTHSGPFTFDFCSVLCGINDCIVGEKLPYYEKLIGSINQRLHYYKYILKGNDFQGDKNHSYVKSLIKLMNEAKVFRFSDRIILAVSNKNAMRICLFFSKILKRAEHPSLIIKDIQRISIRKLD